MDSAKLARAFRYFGREAAGSDSPLYAQLCELIADSPELLALAGRARERTANLFLAAVHDELLRDPRHELAAHYPSAGGDGPGPGLGEALHRFCADRLDRLEATLATRRTQTNETARCAALLPAFAAAGDGRPLAVIEIGASAGLNLRWDHFAYDYGARTAGAPSSPLRIVCELRGSHPPPLDPPPVSWRAGLDISPLDPSDPGGRPLAARLPLARPARASRAARGGDRRRARAPCEGAQGRRADRPSGTDRRGAGGRPRLRVPHRSAPVLHARADR